MLTLKKGPTGRINNLRKILSGLLRTDVLRVLKSFSLGTAAAHGFAESTDFDLIYEGKAYPPKAVLGLASARVVGRPLTADEFSGGEGSACFRILRGLGFTVRPKASTIKTPELVAGGLPKTYQFEVGREYSRSNVFEVIGIEDPRGGNMYTGYASHGDDWFVFCNVGASGRMGHDYGNHFDGDDLVWHGKANSTLRNSSVRSLIAPRGHVYIFCRDDNRKPFRFAGVGTPKRIVDTKPVGVIWQLSPATAVSEAFPDEVDVGVYEGAKKVITVNAYERDRAARALCIAHWGSKCVVCNLDFGELYGDVGTGFIHVHHLKPISEIGAEYRLDPRKDLRPVCPNCHAMLHRSKPILTVEQLRNQLEKRTKR